MYRTAQFADPTLEPPRLPIVPAHVGRQELGKVTEDVDERRSLLVLRFLRANESLYASKKAAGSVRSWPVTARKVGRPAT